VATVATASPELEWLSLASCRRITSAAVVELAATCPRLRTLYLSGCGDDDADGAVAGALAAGCHSLKQLYGCG